MKVKSIDNMERVRLVLGRILVTLGILLVILPVLYRVVNIYFMADKTHNIQGIVDHVGIVEEAAIDPLLLDMKEFNENNGKGWTAFRAGERCSIPRRRIA